MAASYDHQSIENKWNAHWKEHPVNSDTSREKYYCLDMFPYPSGNGLHVGHWRGYVLSDVVSRYKILHGYEILHPMGWDAFGLPAENYAIKTGTHPAETTKKSIENIKRQVKEISAVYDWDREVNTTDPKYYKWTQWIFVQMFKHGLAYEKEMPLNWCPSCKCVLANEEATNGVCDRCGSQVTKKNLRQWMLGITKYAERLLNDLQDLDWPEKVKKMQSEWIGRSYGAEVDFPIEGREDKITVYTTRPDTLYGATFMVLAPEHPLAAGLAKEDTKEAVEKYIYETGIDAVIVQDLGLASLLHKYIPKLNLHASTQMTIYNLESVKELEKLGYKKSVFSTNGDKIFYTNGLTISYPFLSDKFTNDENAPEGAASKAEYKSGRFEQVMYYDKNGNLLRGIFKVMDSENGKFPETQFIIRRNSEGGYNYFN